MFWNYFAMFGQLHIEQQLLVIHGQLINGSGLPDILTQNKFSMIGLGAVVNVNNIKRALQISLCALFSKLEEAAANSMTNLPAYDWLCKKATESASFLYMKMIIDFEMNLLIFVRLIREGNFTLYVQTLRKLLIRFFIFI